MLRCEGLLAIPQYSTIESSHTLGVKQKFQSP